MFDIQKIKESVNIIDVCRSLGIEINDKMDQKILCPSHNEKSPSFHVYEDAKRYHCFGCGEAGDVIDFYELIKGCDSVLAIKEVAKIGGLVEDEAPSLRPPKMPPKIGFNQFVPHNVSLNVDEFTDRLREGFTNELWGFMNRKGLTEEAIIRLSVDDCLGMDLEGRLLYFYPHGVKIRHDFANSRGDRWLEGKAKGAIWRKRIMEFKSVSKVYITEGETDLMALLSHRPESGEEAYIGLAGASMGLSDTDAFEIGFDRSVVLLFDNDDAGRKAIKLAAETFHREVAACTVWTFSWRKAMEELECSLNDIGDLTPDIIKNIDNYLVEV